MNTINNINLIKKYIYVLKLMNNIRNKKILYIIEHLQFKIIVINNNKKNVERSVYNIL